MGKIFSIKNLTLIDIKNITTSISINNLITKLKKEDIEYAVFYKNNKIAGIISHNELLDAYFNEISLNKNASSIINKNFKFLKNTKSLDTILNIFKNNPEKYIIIGDNTGKAEGIITNKVILNYFYSMVKSKVNNFIKEKTKIKTYNNSFIDDNNFNITKILKYLDHLNLWNKELNQAFEYSPNAFVILDGEGNTVRVNKEFENITDLNKEFITGKNVKNMQEKGIYNPSIGVLILKEKRKISIIQTLPNEKEALVRGVPIYDDNGEIFRIIINSIDLKELNIINEYFSEQKKLNNKNNINQNSKIIYKSNKMKEIMEMIQNFKNVDSTVLLTGESGVGKGVIAHYIHNSSIRKKENIVEINCGAIPKSLLESELFGYESGAFTGAKKGGKKGLIELSNGGTLFLDEIGEMPMELQIKLLQVIQERKIIRVGGVKEIEIDIRIIAATNKNLHKLIEEGKFRSDLFYRLNVLPINIPPLRERTLDILPLINYFLNKYNQKYNKNVVMGKSIINIMLEYKWPGNVRELENTIERLVVTNPSKTIEKDTINTNIFNSNIYNKYSSAPDSNESIMPLKKAKNNLEEKMIKMAYQKYKSSYKIAEVLGISQSTAYRKISKYILNKE